MHRFGRDAAVLLIDEIDRADEPFEAYLLEVLADFQIRDPMEDSQAEQPPIVVITSAAREVHDAVKRRCFVYGQLSVGGA